MRKIEDKKYSRITLTIPKKDFTLANSLALRANLLGKDLSPYILDLLREALTSPIDKKLIEARKKELERAIANL